MRVCLAMIIKDEAHVIRRCLESIKPHLDAWMIYDTGSTDGTQRIVQEVMAGVPGRLVEVPWIDFSTNRNQAIADAMRGSDYVLTIDADERFEVDPGFAWPLDDLDSYDVEVVYGGTRYHRKQLLKSTLPWAYEGVVHEYVHCPAASRSRLLEGIRTVVAHEGARARDPHTYLRDAHLLTLDNARHPGNPRTVFYLAQSWRDAGDDEAAAVWYRRRAAMVDGWAEERWHAAYQIGRSLDRLARPSADVREAYLAAYALDPGRAEPLHWLGMHHQRRSEFAPASVYLGAASRLPRPASTRLFVEADVYAWQSALEYGVSLYWLGRYDEAMSVNEALRRRTDGVPGPILDLLDANNRHCLDRVLDVASKATTHGDAQ